MNVALTGFKKKWICAVMRNQIWIVSLEFTLELELSSVKSSEQPPEKTSSN